MENESLLNFSVVNDLTFQQKFPVAPGRGELLEI
jgi:hypothetical protein